MTDERKPSTRTPTAPQFAFLCAIRENPMNMWGARQDTRHRCSRALWCTYQREGYRRTYTITPAGVEAIARYRAAERRLKAKRDARQARQTMLREAAGIPVDVLEAAKGNAP